MEEHRQIILDLEDPHCLITTCSWCQSNPIVVRVDGSSGICAQCLAERYPPDRSFTGGVLVTAAIIASLTLAVLGLAWLCS